MVSKQTRFEDESVGAGGDLMTVPAPPLLVIQENERLRLDLEGATAAQEHRASRCQIFEETDEERRSREEAENAEKNERSLIRMLVQHNRQIGVSHNINVNLKDIVSPPQAQAQKDQTSDDAHQVAPAFLDEYLMTAEEDERFRTTSMVETGHGEVQAMSKQFKLVTSAVLWFCYFSLALDDFIFGPTLDDLSKIMQVDFETISYFAVFRQFAYTLGSLGGLTFNYVNRQVALSLLLIMSAVSLFLTPYSPSLGAFYLIAVLNGFASGSCDVGFHVWILEMFQDGGGPLLQALHFSFGVGIAIAPLIVSPFLSGESECGAGGDGEVETFSRNTSTLVAILSHHLSPEEIAAKRANLFTPYAIIGSIVGLGGLTLGALYFYKKYIPPKERKLPVSFDEQMPKALSRMEKLELWKKSVPSFYIILIISLGSCLLFSYYGLEVTFFQFMAQFTTAVPLPIGGSGSAYMESATGAAYATGGAVAILASLRFHPQKMIYINFVLMNVGAFVLHMTYTSSLPGFWMGNVLIGFGFSSCFATAYTFLEHQITVTNLIGSVFLFASGLGTAVFPLLLSAICEHPQYLVFLAYFGINISLLLFMMLHFMTNIRGKQVKLIKKQLLKAPATLTQFKERTLSTLSYVSNF